MAVPKICDVCKPIAVMHFLTTGFAEFKTTVFNLNLKSIHFRFRCEHTSLMTVLCCGIYLSLEDLL